MGSPSKNLGRASFLSKIAVLYIADYQYNTKSKRFFFEKKQKMHCQFRENIYFCTPFRKEKGGEKDAKNRSFTCCRYNSVGRVADL